MRALLAPILALSLFAAPLQAEPTQLEVSALAHGAKFIGDRSGGARITITDAETGEILAEGITTGGTGNTRLIMAAEQPHWDSIATEGTASFVTELDIDSPLQLAITASGPLDAAPEDRVRASVMSWLLPGDSRTGDRRVIIELPGYLVDVLNIKQTEGRLEATVDISMLCGCPVIPGGWWDATRIDMQARLVGAKDVTSVTLEHLESTRYRAVFDSDTRGAEAIEFHLRGLDDMNVAVKRHNLE